MSLTRRWSSVSNVLKHLADEKGPTRCDTGKALSMGFSEAN